MEISLELVLISLGVFMAVIAVIIYVNKFIKKSYSVGGNPGILLAERLDDNAQLMIVVFLILLNICMGVISGSVHPSDEEGLPIAVRMISHLTIEGMAFICLIFSASSGLRFYYYTAIARTGSVDGKDYKSLKKKSGRYAIYYALLTIACPVIAVTASYKNVEMVAAALQQTKQLQFYWSEFSGSILWGMFGRTPSYEMIPTSLLINSDLVKGTFPNVTYVTPYLGNTYVPFADMNYPLQLMVILFRINLVMGIFDAIISITGPKAENIKNKCIATLQGKIHRNTQATHAPTSAGPSGGAGASSTSGTRVEIKEGLEFILEFLGYSSQKIRTYTDKAVQNVEKASLSNTEHLALTRKLATIYNKTEDLKNRYDVDPDDGGIIDDCNLLGDEFFAFASASVTRKGFGVTISRTTYRDKFK